jgi:diguanylate cyclase (GGDEF)-like protein
MPDFSSEVSHFIVELDAAVEAHMGWTHRVMRCAVLHTSPGEDVLAPQAHTLCRFGHWFVTQRARFEKADAQNARRIEDVHRTMHDAISHICVDILAGRPGQVGDLEVFEQTQAELISLLAKFKTLFLANAMRLDALTGLPLRYGIEDEFTKAVKICHRNKILLFLAMIDIDHFKRINDTHGHPVGDVALRHLANTVKSTLRPEDSLFRFGGEEFLMLLHCQSPEAAAVAAQRIVNRVRNVPVLLPGGEPLKMTITIGLAQVNDDEAMGHAVERTDKALYAGKTAGRDRYIFAGD